MVPVYDQREAHSGNWHLAAIIVASAALYKVVTGPERGTKYAIDKFKEVVSKWGQLQQTSVSQNDCLEVKPIAEFAFSKIRVRSVLKYQVTHLRSTKTMIASQAFDIRVGWSQNDNIRIAIETHGNTQMVTISAPPPHRLNETKVEPTPTILWREDGLINKLTPEDAFELDKQLETDAEQSADWREGQKVAMEGFEKFVRGLFQMQGYIVTFNYLGQVGSDLQKGANNDRPGGI